MEPFCENSQLTSSIFGDFDSFFQELLRRDSSMTLNQGNLQKPLTEIFNVKTGIALEFINGVFEFADMSYNLKNQSKCNRSLPCTERWNLSSVFCRSKSMGQSS